MIATQHSLVARLREGVSNTDWQRFYSLYEKPILAFAAARSLNEADCCDVLQETMVRMLRGGFARFDSAKGRFTAFLFHVTRCCVIDAIRRRQREQSRHVSLNGANEGYSFSTPLLRDNSETPADFAERQGQLALIGVALDFLIEQNCFQTKTIELFKAATLEERDPSEIAQTFQTSTGNVYQAKHAVLTKLRSILVALDRGLDLEQAVSSEVATSPSQRNPVTSPGSPFPLREKVRMRETAAMIISSSNDLEKMILESRTTLRAIPNASLDVFDRVEKFVRTYSRLETKPTRAALLYHPLPSPVPSFEEVGSELTVGRLSKSERHPHGADLAIEDPLLSRRHFSVQFSGGFYILRDLGSHNGTYLNNESDPIDERILKAGDVIRAGGFLFIFTGTPDT